VIHMKVNKEEIVQKFIGSVFEEQGRNLDPKLLSKHRLGKSSEPMTKNIWKTGEFADEGESDDDEKHRSKSIQVVLRHLNACVTIPSMELKEGVSINAPEQEEHGLTAKEKKSIRRELNEFAKKLERQKTRKKTTTALDPKEDAQNEPLDLHGLIEN